MAMNQYLYFLSIFADAYILYIFIKLLEVVNVDHVTFANFPIVYIHL